MLLRSIHPPRRPQGEHDISYTTKTIVLRQSLSSFSDFAVALVLADMPVEARPGVTILVRELGVELRPQEVGAREAVADGGAGVGDDAVQGRTEPPAREEPQRVAHVDDGAPRARLEVPPLPRARILRLQAPVAAEQHRQALHVRVRRQSRVAARVGELGVPLQHDAAGRGTRGSVDGRQVHPGRAGCCLACGGMVQGLQNVDADSVQGVHEAFENVQISLQHLGELDVMLGVDLVTDTIPRELDGSDDISWEQQCPRPSYRHVLVLE